MPSTCKWARYSCLVGAGSGRTRSTFGRSAALAPAGLLLSTADTSQSFTTPSPDAEAMCRPAASDASDQILEVWPASVLTQRPGVASGSQSRTVLSLPPVITNLPRCEPNGSCSGYLRLRSFGAHVLVLVPVRLCPCPSVIVCACVCLYVHVPVPVPAACVLCEPDRKEMQRVSEENALFQIEKASAFPCGLTGPPVQRTQHTSRRGCGLQAMHKTHLWSAPVGAHHSTWPSVRLRRSIGKSEEDPPRIIDHLRNAPTTLNNAQFMACHKQLIPCRKGSGYSCHDTRAYSQRAVKFPVFKGRNHSK